MGYHTRVVALSHYDHMFIDVDVSSPVWHTIEPVNTGVFSAFEEMRSKTAKIISYLRREIMMEAQGPQELLFRKLGRFPPLHAVVYVLEELPLNDDTMRRAANAVWPCNCGCMEVSE